MARAQPTTRFNPPIFVRTWATELLELWADGAGVRVGSELRVCEGNDALESRVVLLTTSFRERASHFVLGALFYGGLPHSLLPIFEPIGAPNATPQPDSRPKTMFLTLAAARG